MPRRSVVATCTLCGALAMFTIGCGSDRKTEEAPPPAAPPPATTTAADDLPVFEPTEEEIAAQAVLNAVIVIGPNGIYSLDGKPATHEELAQHLARHARIDRLTSVKVNVHRSVKPPSLTPFLDLTQRYRLPNIRMRRLP